MQPGVPAEAGRAKAVTQRQAAERQASQRQAAERPLPFPGSGADAFVRRRRNPKFRKAGANAPSLPVGSEGPKGGHQCSVRCRRNPSVRGPAGGSPHPGGSLRESALAGAPFAGSTHARALRKRPSPESALTEAPSAGSARAGGFSRERPCGRVPAKAPVREGSRGSASESARKRPGCAPKAPRVCPGSYCFGFGCAERWLSSSSAASSAR